MYAYCEARHVPHKRLGKLVFAATVDQLDTLHSIMTAAKAADVRDLELLANTQVRKLEPSLTCAGALLSPSTGIVDAHGLMMALIADAEDAGATLAYASQVTKISRHAGGWGVHVDGDANPCLIASWVINCAGLSAQSVAQNIEELDPNKIPPLAYAKGSYFAYAGRHPFSRLIYPVPEAGGLGTHLTLDLQGAARFGPDVQWVDEIDFSVDGSRYGQFLEAARRIWPSLNAERLHPDYAGIRPKLTRAGEPAADFVVSTPADHGLPGIVNLFGIESPGLTASLAIGEMVATLMLD
jgi:L-2-hydroxyglutarate oxidase LhgO